MFPSVNATEEQDGSADLVMAATSRDSVPDAIAWLAENHPMPPDTNWPRLLQALVEILDDGDELHDVALRRATREVASSKIDTGRALFDVANIPSPATFKQALDALVSRSTDGTLGGLTARGVMRAQYADERAIETLCYVVGIGYGDARKWFMRGGSWTDESIAELLAYLNDLVGGAADADMPNTEPARAIELLDEGDGWEKLEQLRTGGVPYELLLAQRAVGGPWLQHKNRTSQFANVTAADMVCDRLKQHGLSYRRSKTVGGAARQKDLQELSGIPDKRVGVVTLDTADQPTFGIAFSSANDGGTARANGDGLLQIPMSELPFAFVLTGQGWADRGETVRLARRCGGRLFTERTIDDLVDHIEAATA